MQLRIPASVLAVVLCSLTGAAHSHAQTQGSPAAATPPEAPGAQPAPAAALPPMPPVSPENFTASSPSVDTVNSFFKQSWGYDPNRIWQVQAIQKTTVQGISRVVALVEEKGSGQQQPQSLSFFVLPDGKHLIADDILPFGARPFEDYRNLLSKEANGPSRGAASKDLEFVEFADFECPHCKDAQPTIDKLLKDYPNAHYVFENFPLTQLHTEALKASEYGVCVAKAGGNDAFFKFADAIFTNQAALTPEGSAEALKKAASAAGQDPAKVAACASTPEAKAMVDAQQQLGIEIGVNSTPTLFVNGRGLPFMGIPYDTLKQIIDYQEKIDGVVQGSAK